LACTALVLIHLSFALSHSRAATWNGSINDNWSTTGNWTGGSPSGTNADFNTTDNNGTNIVDAPFSIANLRYLAGSTHTTTLSASLSLSGNLVVGQDGAAVSTAHVQGSGISVAGDINVGYEPGSSGQVNSGILNMGGGTITPNNVRVGVARTSTSEWRVPTGETLQIGTSADPASSLLIGVRISWSGGSSPTGILAPNGGTLAGVYTDSLIVGHYFSATSASNPTGTLTLSSGGTLNVGVGLVTPNPLYIGFAPQGTTINAVGNVTVPNGNVNVNASDVIIGGNPTTTSTFDTTGSTTTLAVTGDIYIAGHIGSGGAGSNRGTLIMGGGTVTPDEVYIGRGNAPTGIWQVPTGQSLQLGTAGDRLSTLQIGIHSPGSTGTATGSLVPTGSGTIDGIYTDNLIVGRNDHTSGSGVGTLTLSSGSTLHVGTISTPGVLHVGYGSAASSNTTTNAILTAPGSNVLHLTDFFVGVNNFAGGTLAAGTFSATGGPTTVTATNIRVGPGADSLTVTGAGSDVSTTNLTIGASGASVTLGGAGSAFDVSGTLSLGGTLNLQDGHLYAGAVTGAGTFNWTGGKFGAGTFGTNLTQNGASTVLAPGASPGIMTINGNYNLTNGTLEIEIDGLAGAGLVGGHDLLDVDGTVTLNATNSILDIIVGGPISVGDLFLVIDNNLADAISGTFGTVTTTAGYAFDLHYNSSLAGGDGNDLVLEVTEVPSSAVIPEPSTFLLAALGLVALFILRRKRS